MINVPEFSAVVQMRSHIIYNLNYLLCYEDKNVKKCALLSRNTWYQKMFFYQTDRYTSQFSLKNNIKSSKIDPKNKQTQ